MKKITDEPKDKYYIVTTKNALKKATMYFRDKGYPYHVEPWTRSAPLDDEDDVVIEYHIIFLCTERQSTQVGYDLNAIVFLYFGRN